MSGQRFTAAFPIGWKLIGLNHSGFVSSCVTLKATAVSMFTHRIGFRNTQMNESGIDQRSVHQSNVCMVFRCGLHGHLFWPTNSDSIAVHSGWQGRMPSNNQLRPAMRSWVGPSTASTRPVPAHRSRPTSWSVVALPKALGARSVRAMHHHVPP